MIRRREWLRLLGGGALAGTAGCLTERGSEPSATPQQTAQVTAATATSTATDSAQETATQTPVPSGTVRKLAPADGGELYQFGTDVALDGDRALIGAPAAANEAGTRTGTVYVYERSGAEWTNQAVLAAEDGFLGHGFGQVVALSGDLAVVGAKMYEQGRAVYIFERREDGWQERTKLTNETVGGDGEFGRGFDVRGDRLAVSGRRDGNRIVTLYALGDGALQKEGEVVAPTETAGNVFGQSLALTDQQLLVGAPAPVGSEEGADVAYLYRTQDGDWAQEATFRPLDTSYPSSFGDTVALAEDVAVIGSMGEHPTGHYSGAGYVFERDGDGWELREKVVPADGDGDDHFGNAVAASSEMAVFGAHHDETTTGKHSGASYAYGRDSSGWGLVEKLVPADGDSEDKFGTAVAVAGRTVLVGAFFDEDPNGEGGGAAYVFQL